MNIETFGKVFAILQKAAKHWIQPAVGALAGTKKNRAFRVLVSTVISLRTKDSVTDAASRRLFEQAQTARELLKLTPLEIEKLIYPAGFYRTKAKALRAMSQQLVDEHGGQVPNDLENLLRLPGVGRKTANLVLTEGFGLPGICVDVHVHRITHRLGLLTSKNPDQTEMILREILPQDLWRPINEVLVAFGQNICQPVSPKCSECPIRVFCPRLGVVHSR